MTAPAINVNDLTFGIEIETATPLPNCLAFLGSRNKNSLDTGTRRGNLRACPTRSGHDLGSGLREKSAKSRPVRR